MPIVKTAAAFVLLAALCAPPAIASEKKSPPPPAKSRVYESYEAAALLPDRRPNPRIIRRMVDRLVCAATGKPDPASAWRSLVKPADRVGIKVAASPGPIGGTRPTVAEAVAQSLAAAGIPQSNIIVWDRNLDDLLSAGYRKDSPHYRLRWTDSETGYDKNAILTAPVIGRLIWGDKTFGKKEGTRMVDILTTGEQLSSTSYFAKILSKEVTKVVNIPSLCDSFLTGVNGALANMAISNIDNWRRFVGPPDFGDPYLAEIYADQTIRGKVVLTILDALTMQYAGGPLPNPNYTADQLTLYASLDPVAIDATAVTLLDPMRKASKLPLLEKSTRWLASAETLGLGKHRTEDIELIPAATPQPPPRR